MAADRQPVRFHSARFWDFPSSAVPVGAVGAGAREATATASFVLGPGDVLGTETRGRMPQMQFRCNVWKKKVLKVQKCPAMLWKCPVIFRHFFHHCHMFRHFNRIFFASFFCVQALQCFKIGLSAGSLLCHGQRMHFLAYTIINLLYIYTYQLYVYYCLLFIYTYTIIYTYHIYIYYTSYIIYVYYCLLFIYTYTIIYTYHIYIYYTSYIYISYTSVISTVYQLFGDLDN